MTSGNIYQECFNEQISIGDIILIEQQEYFPADVLLLDCENEYCFCDSYLLNGQINFQKKFSMKLTSSFFFFNLAYH